MAFQQPQHRPQPVYRQPSPTTHAPAPQSPALKQTIAESQEWILFSPRQHDDSETNPRTATHSYGAASLGTHIQSHAGERKSENDDQGSEVEDEAAELDSLDDGLYAFHHPFSASSTRPLEDGAGAILPTHDGLGTFPSAHALQEPLWQLERHSPHRKSPARQRSSVRQKLDAMEQEMAASHEDERTSRIEKWRLDQSRAVAEEIERESRRRRTRKMRIDISKASNENVMTLRRADDDNVVIASEAGPQPPDHDPPPTESFWQRITRRVIRDLMGLDDDTLAVIFGEALPGDDARPHTASPPIGAAPSPDAHLIFADPEPTWQARLLDRIARELGTLVHQLCEHDGRAFNTHLRSAQPPDSAGLRPARDQHPDRPRPAPSLRHRTQRHPPRDRPDPIFAPTLPPPTPSSAPDTPPRAPEDAPDRDHARQERDYWERDLDVHMVFSFLKRRFRRPPAAPPSRPAASASPDRLRRAEAIRRHHPLVPPAAPLLLRRHLLPRPPMHKRAASSSCASQSTRRSRHHSRSVGSRHYWLDGGGSGGGSGPAVGSAWGGWGEV